MDTEQLVSIRQAKRNMNFLISAVPPGSVFGAVSTGSMLAGLLLAVKMNQEQIGLVMSLTLLFLPMQLIGSFLQVHYFNRKKFWIFFGSLAYLFFAMIAILVALWGDVSQGVAIGLFLTLFACAQISTQLSGAVVLAWQGEVIPTRESNTFWTRKTSVTMISTIGSGILLGALADYLGRERSSTYAILLALGVVFGFLSIFLQTRVPEVQTAKVVLPKVVPILKELFAERNFRQLMSFFAVQSFAGWLMCGFIFIYLQTAMNFSQLNIQLLLAFSGIVSFFSGFFFKFFGNRYGRKPLLIICSVIKCGEFILWGLLLPGNNWLDNSGLHLIGLLGIPTGWIPEGFIGALPIFFLGGFVNMGLGAGQLSLLTSTGRRETQSIQIALFFTVIGLTGALSSGLSGILYTMIGEGDLPAITHLSPFNLLSIAGGIGYLLSVLWIARFHESGAAPTVMVVKSLLAHNPFRAIYQAYVLDSPLDEASRAGVIRHARGGLVEDRLLSAIHSPSSVVRESALSNLAHNDDGMTPQMEKELISLLYNPRLSLRQMAAMLLGKNRCGGALPDLLRFVEDRDIDFANSCIYAVGLLRDQSAAVPLFRILQNPARNGSWAMTAEALSRIGTFEHAETIWNAYEQETDWVLSQQCLIALCRTIQTHSGELQPLFEGEYKQQGSSVESVVEQLTRLLRLRDLKEKAQILLDEQKYASLLECFIRVELEELQIEPPDSLADLKIGGRFRNIRLEEKDYFATSLRIQFRLWSYLLYDGDKVDSTKLLAALILARDYVMVSGE